MKLSPKILWVDEIIMGSTIRHYMLIRWDENLSLAMCGVYGKTALTQYMMVRLEDDRDTPPPILIRG